MKFKDEVIPIACVENFDVKTFETEYELSERSQMKLNELCEDLCSQNRSMCVIFASCFSHQSPIKQFLIEKGLYAAIDINKDRGEITGGRIYAMDKDQKEVNDEFRKVFSYIILIKYLKGF